MQIERIIKGNRVIRKLTPEEEFAGRNVMEQCLAVKKGEKVLVLTNPPKLDEAAIFFEAAKSFTDKVTLLSFSEMTENAQEPPPEIQKAMAEADIAFLITLYSLTHTRSRQEACNAGTRIASMPGITKETVLRTLSIDYQEIARLSKKTASILTNGRMAFLSAKNGTEIIFNLEGRNGLADSGLITNPGDCGNLPAGEALIAPLEGTTEGILVFDGCFADIVLDQPIKVLVEKGRAVDIQGGEAARILNRRLSAVGELGYNIAELGIGTNKMAELGNNLLEVEKVYETVHVALGNNATMGGEVDVPFHSDGVILKPTLRVDSQFILRDGEFML